jgi:hypothetical protein
MRPVSHPSGTVRPTAHTIGSTYGTDLFQNQVVRIDADGTIKTAAAGETMLGAFQGVEWTDNEGRRRVSNRWTASTVGTDIVCYVASDPATTFEMQTSATAALTDNFAEFDIGSGTGNSTTGISTQTLNMATGSATAGIQIIGLAPYADNAWGDSFVIVRVRMNEHQMAAAVAGT